MKNEKIVLIISHLQEARGKTLATMKVPGQHLLQANEPTSDDNDKKGGHDTVVVGEIWCSETEGMLSESENDDSECELLPSPVKKNAALEVDTLCIQLVNRLTLNSIEKCLDLNNIVRCLTGRGIFQNAEHRMSHFTPPMTV